MSGVICDLDGVLYRGSAPVPGSPQALARLVESGRRIRLVTNNSMRTPEQVAEKISRIMSVEVDPKMVLTSAQAAAGLLTPRDVPAMVVGGDGIRAALAEASIAISDNPGEVNSLVVGLDRSLTYQTIADAADAVRRGARFIASNNDATFPWEKGLAPGAGAIVSAIATASGVAPEVAGKPHLPMRELIRGDGLEEAWVIGDRIDTDVAMARSEPGWTSILVLSGVTGPEDDLDGPDHVVSDLAAAVDLILGSGS